MPTRFIRSDILAQSVYHVADVPDDFIKLDAMEVPYTFPEHLQQVWAEQLLAAPINRYPNPATSGLQQALRDAFGIPSDAAIALGNGSDELIQFLTLLVAQSDATMLAIEPSFVMYRRNAELFGMNYVGVPLNADFSLNLPAVLEAIEQHNPALTFIAYPNNPTGTPFEREQIEQIVQTAKGIVVIDEAYGAFADDSLIGQAGQPANLVVMRTLSKIGFAGLRVGYAAGSPVIMNELAKILPPYNMNQLSLTTAKFALQNMDVVNGNIATLKAERERVADAMRVMTDTTVFDSQANFLTVRVPDAPYMFTKLKENKILVKNLHGTHDVLQNCLRFTIGTPEQNDAVLRVVQMVIAEHEARKLRAGSDDSAGLSGKLMWGVAIATVLLIVLSLILGLAFGKI